MMPIHDMQEDLLYRITTELDRRERDFVWPTQTRREQPSQLWTFLLLAVVTAGLTMLLLALYAARTKGQA